MPTTDELALQIDAALPQTQCTRCGYPDCAAYARAVASGEAGIDQCPPGGAEGIEQVLSATGQTSLGDAYRKLTAHPVEGVKAA